ncbi:MAG: hypothetical protein K8R67_19375 [Desulfobacteraceae bacterium]|nr:hypothetical protein [Desulfobacteraceae bacterium]
MMIKDLFKFWTYQVFLPGTVLREKYKAFKALLIQDTRAHEIIADLEEIYYQKKQVDIQAVEKKHRKLAKCVSRMVVNLSKISPVRYHSLKDYFKKFNFYIEYILASEQYSFAPPFVLNINPESNAKTDGINHNYPLIAGGKANHLSILCKTLKVRSPKSFVVTTNTFRYFLEYNNLSKVINKLLSEIDITQPANLNMISQELIQCILDAAVPKEIEDLIMECLGSMRPYNKRSPVLAVRSSAVAEDGICSFAGQYKSVLNVLPENVINAYKEVLASKYSPHALYYRITRGISDTDTPMAVLIMEMIDARESGVMYTRDIENFGSEDLVIYSVKGLGEQLVSGKADPFSIRVNRSPQGMISAGNEEHKLARVGLEIENYFGQPQDIEWCRDNDGNLFILQTRSLSLHTVYDSGLPPESDISSQNQLLNDQSNIDYKENPILLQGGNNASAGMGSGKTFHLKHLSQLEEVPDKTVLVTKHPLPELVTIIGKLSAVVTDTGSVAGHFASVAREFGVPMLVNTSIATQVLEHGKLVTVHGDLKMVFQGSLSVQEGIHDMPGAESDPFEKTPFMKTLSSVMQFISPLRLVNPSSNEFTPEGCRSFHDIIRFCHEKAVQEMFSHGRRKGSRKKGAIKLVSDIPMLFYILDVGEGIKQNLPASKEVHVDDIICSPFQAVYKGLSNPGIKWEQFSNYDWATYDNIVMSGGIISPDNAQFGSYAIIAADYLNINLRFGYHFVILDTFCGQNPEKNYILFRFSGGGGSPAGRELRAAFLTGVLTFLGFVVETKGEMVDGQLKHADFEEIKEKLDWVGRLLGATRLMDMQLKEGADINLFVNKFLNGQYDFRSFTDDKID